MTEACEMAKKRDVCGKLPGPRYIAAAVLALVLLSILVRLPFFVEPPGRDQSLFMTQASLLRDGARLYTDVWEHKPPGMIAVYWLALTLLGEDFGAVHIANWLAGLVTAVLLLALVFRSTRSLVTGVLCGLLYLLCFSGPLFGGFWSMAQAEVFIDPFIVLSLLLASLSRRAPRQRALVYAVVAGISVGMAVFIKYTALPFAAMALLMCNWRTGGLRSSMGRVVAMALGVLLVTGAVISYFALTRRLSLLWDATILFNMQHRAMAAKPLLVDLHTKLFYAPELLAGLYALAAGAVIAVVGKRDPSGRKRDLRWIVAAGLLAYLCGLISVFGQAKFWAYHYQTILVPLCILAALGVHSLAGFLRRRLKPAGAYCVIAIVLMVVLAPIIELIVGYSTSRQIGARWRRTIDQEAFDVGYAWGGMDYNFAETHIVASRIAQSTVPGDRILVWGFEPGIYFFADRAPSTRFLYDYPLMPEFSRVHDRYLAQFMDDLHRHPPAAIVVVKNDANDLEREDSATQLSSFGPLTDYIAAAYERAWESRDFLCYRRSTP